VIAIGAVEPDRLRAGCARGWGIAELVILATDWALPKQRAFLVVVAGGVTAMFVTGARGRVSSAKGAGYAVEPATE